MKKTSIIAWLLTLAMLTMAGTASISNCQKEMVCRAN